MKRSGSDPAWLYFENGKWLVDETRADVVRWIFQRAYAGRSASEISDELNEPQPTESEDGPLIPLNAPNPFPYTPVLRRIPPISDRARKGGKDKDAWDEKDVHTLLTNKRVCGTADYPQIVHQSTFDAVQLQRLSSPGGQQRSPNLFAGLLFCAKCNSALRLRSYKKPSRRIIECSNGHTGKWPYSYLEAVILEQRFGYALLGQTAEVAPEVRASEKEKKALLIKQRLSGMVRRAIDRIEVGHVGDGLVEVIRRAS